MLAVGADQEENDQLDSTHHVVDDARNCPTYCSRPSIMNSYLPRPFLYRMYLLSSRPKVKVQKHFAFILGHVSSACAGRA